MLRPTVSGSLLVVLGVVVSTGLGLSGKAKDDPVAPAVRPRDRARALRELLDRPITVEFDTSPLKDPLGHLQDRYNVTILVDEDAFKEHGQADIKDQVVKLEKLAGVKLRTALRLLLAQVQGDFLEQDGQVVVVPKSRLTAASLFLQPIDAAFERVPLADALQELAALTGVSVVLDNSAAEQAKFAVTATFTHASLEAAVRVLANMAALKPVAIDKVLYVTTYEKADEFGEESGKTKPTMPPAQPKGVGK